MAESFYLAQLDVSVDASSAAFAGAVTNAFSGDCAAEVDVSYSVLRNLFQFSTDASDIDNLVATDILYKVDYTTQAEPLGIDLDTNTLMYDLPIQSGATDNHVTYDFVRYLALKLTNTYLGVDLFSNETELRENLNSTFKTNFDAVLVGLAADGETTSADSSPSKSILSQIISNNPSRLNDITVYNVAGTWHQTPINAGDMLYFILTISAAADQESLTSVSAIANRRYLIRVNAV